MPRDGTATRERILHTAERLMTDQGYNATSLDQVIAESSSSKGAFFHHFSSKADLALQLDRAVRRRRPRPPRRRPRPPSQDIDGPAGAARGVPALLRGRRRRAHVGAVRLPLRHRARRAGVHRQRHQRPRSPRPPSRGAPPWSTCCVPRWPPAGRDLDIDVDALADHLFTTFEGGFILCRTLARPLRDAAPSSECSANCSSRSFASRNRLGTRPRHR